MESESADAVHPNPCPAHEQCRLLKEISLSLTENYASSWTVWEGVRELVVNWHDGLRQTLYDVCALDYSLEHEQAIERARNIQIEYGSEVIREQDEKGADRGRNTYRYTAKAKFPSGTEFPESFEPSDDGASAESADWKWMPLGNVEYYKTGARLSLVNHRTELLRPVLLMGYTTKLEREEMIGVFGEGLKVAALTLLKKGMYVSTETTKDIWQFCLSPCKEFEDERVLSVRVLERPARTSLVGSCTKLADDDTLTVLEGIKEDDWDMYCQRFLFLNMSERDEVSTKQGMLLLDEQYRGHLYVKSVWVTDDLKDSHLATGVNFHSLLLDRDRRAVIGRHFVDYQVVSMWMEALKLRPKLIERYYKLLEENNTCDVRHASAHVDDVVANAVLQRFYEVHGENSYPVPHNIDGDLVRRLSQQLKKDVVPCNNNLLQVLSKTNRITPIEDMLTEEPEPAVEEPEPEPQPPPQLSKEQGAVLSHTTALVQLVLPSFSDEIIDIIRSPNPRLTQGTSEHRIGIPLLMLDKVAMHRSYRLCSNWNRSPCMCCEVHLCRMILQYLTRKKALLKQINGVLESQENTTLRLLNSLARQTCGLSGPFCAQEQEEEFRAQGVHEQCRNRENSLQQAFDAMQEEIRLQEKEFQEELVRMEQHKEGLKEYLEGIVAEKEARKVRMKEMFEEQHQVVMKKEQDRRDDQLSVLDKMKEYSEELKKQVEDKKTACERQQEDRYRAIDNLQKVQQNHRQELAQSLDDLYQLREYMQAGETDKIMVTVQNFVTRLNKLETLQRCIKCQNESRNCFLEPCNHLVICVACADKVISRKEQCPYCGHDVNDRKKVFLVTRT